MKEKTVAFHTLGCKLNFAETGTIARDFIERGYKIVDFSALADVYVVHTCTVTSVAEKKCRTAISQAVRRNPDAQVAVIGCYAQLRATDIQRIEGVKVVLDNQEKYRLAEIIDSNTEIITTYLPCHHPEAETSGISSPDSFHLSWSGDDRTRTFLKIQDGCNHFCSYCAIPFARGRSRSAAASEIVETIGAIFSGGMKEIVLTGVNIGDFGKPMGESLYDLLYLIEKQGFIGRIRISSIEPELLTDDIIDLVATSRVFLPHFHLPLQSGSDDVLKAMRRKYDTTLFAGRVEAIRRRMPAACIAADVIVGFPGETDEHFASAYRFIESLSISYLHVFSYSERPGTSAINIEGKVSPAIKQHRSKELHLLSENRLESFYNDNIGRQEEVLFESANQKGYMEGFTRNYLRVKTIFNEAFINHVVKVDLNARHQDGAFLFNTQL
ncbi:MAG TPA: tRNA (N(6)-L-threonylcarbamoyladenosine(37)-C(2))-methylthiotransferase MtaB [Bacteroidales bacterium]|nr:MAG: tRNA (N(6)-L-threonylcarbamoyladenosine(37)-C(2))-methylthiotransferase MtaB [Bacteroidetes bacterium GWE2_42_24]OFY31363.1 MAG: tRNA (N(6)-L-threonylcarbamoyladenosine(37)-C(2))-methylthiotransferase MtaB [Bacteroidetes bacterium GWF2_43_11]HBZ67765.1 tRNA (N(6)-L-threonylcarbamoyladenosine(37)-C(2))-methylthiotransferase MtaB [Bacteroidales bacterium]